MTIEKVKISVDQEISQLNVERPHVVILGAGASLAATPNGDLNGTKLPLMKNFVDVLGLRPLLKKHKIQYRGQNFEKLYSQSFGDPSRKAFIEELEEVIRDYFCTLELPDHPTIYDHLLLSLRPKDVVATFNWDPFLIQAHARNRDKVPLPELLFLHGCADLAYCLSHNAVGSRLTECPKCQNVLEPTPILFPVEKKNYTSTPFIDREWKALRHHLKGAFMLTIFGYGAPKTDVEAVSLMKEPWQENISFKLAETEIIDVREEDALRKTWKPFIFSHHHMIKTDFYDSWSFNHPRRSCEALYNVTMMGKFAKNSPMPRDADFPELYQWLGALLKAEEKAEAVGQKITNEGDSQ